MGVTLADSIVQNIGIPSPGAVNDKLIAFFSRVLMGVGVPSGSQGVDGAFYFDANPAAAGSIYNRQAGVWALASSGGAGGNTPEVPAVVPAAGASQTITLTDALLVSDITLSAASCALTFAGFPGSGISPQLGQIFVRVHQDAITTARKITFAQTILWAGGYEPVMPSPITSVLEFWIYSLDGGTTLIGACSQPVRTHILPFVGTLAVTTGTDLDYFDFDARVVKVRPITGVVPVSTAALFDLKMGVGQGAPTTMYTTTGNRPSVAAGNRTNTSVTLPDTTLILPGNYIAGDVVTASSAGSGALAVKCIEAA